MSLLKRYQESWKFLPLLKTLFPHLLVVICNMGCSQAGDVLLLFRTQARYVNKTCDSFANVSDHVVYEVVVGWRKEAGWKVRKSAHQGVNHAFCFVVDNLANSYVSFCPVFCKRFLYPATTQFLIQSSGNSYLGLTYFREYSPQSSRMKRVQPYRQLAFSG